MVGHTADRLELLTQVVRLGLCKQNKQSTVHSDKRDLNKYTNSKTHRVNNIVVVKNVVQKVEVVNFEPPLKAT